MNSPPPVYRCTLCGKPKELRAFVCAECRRQIQMRRRRRIGLASPFSKSRLQRLPPPTSNKH
jgi:DNA-directed RNA polymerase subunit RPC12/RpoP